jgi:general secretion pathway protein K
MTYAHTRRGAVLILVLWTITVLAMLAGGLTFAMRQDLAIASLQQSRVVAHGLARAGVERAIAEVMDDLRAVDNLEDLWCDDPGAFQAVQLSDGTFSVLHDSYETGPSYGVGDESAKLNVNSATREQLMALPHMTTVIAGAIIDWRDADEEPQPDGTEGGYYSSLSHPYTIRNGPFQTVRELLLVRGVTEELLYGEDANGNGRLDANENDGDATSPPDNRDSRLDRGWFAYLTVHSYEKNRNGLGERRVNINSADADTLEQKLSLESWAAQSIVKAREQHQFEHLVDLLDVKLDPELEHSQREDNNNRDSSEKDTPVTKTIFKRIIDDITLSDDEVLPGRININTAPAVVLETLPGIDAKTADAIVRSRDRTGYRSIADLLDISGMTTDIFKQFESLITIRSNVFRIYSEGRTSTGLAEATATIECVVDRGEDVPQIRYWLESTP